MKQLRRLEFLVVLVCVVLLAPLCQQGTPSEPMFAPGQTSLRWSTRGGCYSDSDFYFEVQTDAGGARWIGVLHAYGIWLEGLYEPENPKQLPSGLYVARGRLSLNETEKLLSQLRDMRALEIREHMVSTAPFLSLYLELDGQTNKVDSFQSNPKQPQAPESQFASLAYSDSFTTVRKSLKARWGAREAPDTVKTVDALSPPPNRSKRPSLVAHCDRFVFSVQLAAHNSPVTGGVVHT